MKKQLGSWLAVSFCFLFLFFVFAFVGLRLDNTKKNWWFAFLWG